MICVWFCVFREVDLSTSPYVDCKINLAFCENCWLFLLETYANGHVMFLQQKQFDILFSVWSC